MNSGAATQIFSATFDRRFFTLPADVQSRIQHHLDDLGRSLRSFPHHPMQGIDAFRLRVGDYRIIYQFDTEQNLLLLIAVGHRREVYKS